MSDTARVLVTAAVLSGLAFATWSWRIARAEDDSARLVGQLRLMQWAAVLIATIGAVPIGMALGALDVALAHIDVALAVIFAGTAGLVLQREPREGLLLATGVFIIHALIDIAHRPGWLAADMAPRWFTIGCAVYNVFLAACCFRARRR